jgi:hypothetical protein
MLVTVLGETPSDSAIFPVVADLPPEAVLIW